MTSAHGATGTMRQASVEPQVRVRVDEAEIPRPAVGEALVRSSLVGICGSDTHALAGQHPFLTATYVPGHEAVGTVEALGSEGSGLTVGQRVLLKPNVTCGVCVNCAAGRSNACETLTWIGCDPTRVLSGAMADFFIAPVTNLYSVPDGLDNPTAALVECLATPVHAARIAGELTGARVVILGAGTIGLLSVIAALEAGAATVVVTDLEQSKIDRAVRSGAHGGVLASSAGLAEEVRSSLGGPADVIFDCVANERSLAQAVALVRRAGTVLVVGVPPRPAAVNLPIVQDWELRVQGCAAYTEDDLVRSIAIAVAGRLPTSVLLAGSYPLEDVEKAFAAASAETSGKVMINPRLAT